MKKVGDSFGLTATDLVGYLYCHHFSGLDRLVAERRFAEAKDMGPASPDLVGTRCSP
jgi:hypothetical protein